MCTNLVLIVLMVAAMLAPSVARAQAQPIVSKIEIAGNQRVEEDAIRIHITQQVGQPLDPVAVDNDVKSIYRLNFFENVTPHLVQRNGQTVLVYYVKERPQITDVKFYGMKAIRSNDDKIVAATKLHPGTILNPVDVKETINEVSAVYADKGYTDAKVTFKAIPQPDNTAFGEFDVVEGSKVEITKIQFVGNHAFSSTVLGNNMETRPYSKLLSWITGWGALDPKKLQEDVDRLTAFYYDNGYLNVQIAPPQIIRNAEKITIVINIDEGTPYRVGRLDIEGNLKFPRRELRKQLTMKSGQLFRGSSLQRQVLALSDFYSNRGYAYVNVDPRTQLVRTNKRVNVVFVINPGHEVLIDRINISGNTKTSDKVIRREIQVQEQEPYSAEEIRDSQTRLQRLGFFSDTRITTAPASQPDKINLNVNVTEANTASFQVAGGFDSYQSIFGNFTLGNTNLFGGGESLIANAQVGFLFQNYSISYTEPWFLDIPLGVGLQLFDNKTYLLSFNQSSAGFTLTTTYPLTELGFKKLGPILAEGYNRRNWLLVSKHRNHRAERVYDFPNRALQRLYADFRNYAHDTPLHGGQSDRSAHRHGRDSELAVRRTRRHQFVRQGCRAFPVFLPVPQEPDPGDVRGVAGSHLRHWDQPGKRDRRRVAALRAILPGGSRRTGRRARLSALFVGTAGDYFQPERHAAQCAGRWWQQGVVAQQRNNVPDIIGIGHSRRDIQRCGTIVPAEGFDGYHQAAGVGRNRRALEIAIRAAGGGYRVPDQPAAGGPAYGVRSRRRIAAVVRDEFFDNRRRADAHNWI